MLFKVLFIIYPTFIHYRLFPKNNFLWYIFYCKESYKSFFGFYPHSFLIFINNSKVFSILKYPVLLSFKIMVNATPCSSHQMVMKSSLASKSSVDQI